MAKKRKAAKTGKQGSKSPKVVKMSKRKPKADKEPKKAKPAATAGGRVTTFKPNGPTAAKLPDAVSALNLGPLDLPTGDDAVKVLRELADLNDRALVAQQRYEELKGQTKTAKEKYDDLAGAVLARLRSATHKTDLPLFADIEKREADQAQMEAGTEEAPPAVEPETPLDTPYGWKADAPESEPAAEGAEPPSDPPAVPEVEGVLAAEALNAVIPDEEIPF